MSRGIDQFLSSNTSLRENMEVVKEQEIAGGNYESIGSTNEGSNITFSTPRETELNICEFKPYALRDYNDPNAILSLMLVFLGLMYCVLGYRCLKATMFLTGFVFGSLMIFLVCPDSLILHPFAKIALSITVGVIFGLITMLVQYVGFFLTGFYTGIITCFASVATANYFNYNFNNVWFNIGFLLLYGLLYALCTLKWKKGLTIIGTSAYGAAIVTGTLDYFLEKLVMIKWLWEKIIVKDNIRPCEMSYLVLLVWPAMLLFGIFVQCAVNGRRIYHKRHDKHSSRQSSVRTRSREQSADSTQRKYRYLYKVRTAHGDVISQNYVQALQKKVIPGITTMESSTLQSDATHLTTLPVDQTLTQLSDSKSNTVDSSDSIQYENKYNLNSRECIPCTSDRFYP